MIVDETYLRVGRSRRHQDSTGHRGAKTTGYQIRRLLRRRADWLTEHACQQILIGADLDRRARPALPL